MASFASFFSLVPHGSHQIVSTSVHSISYFLIIYSQRLFRFLSVIHLVHLWYLFLQCSSLILLVLFLFLVFNLIHSFLFQFSVLVIVFFSHILSFFFSHIQRIVKRIDLLFSLSFVMFSPSSSHSDHRRYFSVLAAR